MRRYKARLMLRALEERALMSATILNGGGNGYAGMSIAQGGATPPDTWGGAGPSVFMETVNSAVSIYNPKATGASVVTDNLDHFFFTTGGLTHIDSGAFLGDATGAYDDRIGRFIIADMDVNFSTHVSAIQMAVSKSSSPTTLTTADWKFYKIVTTQANFDSDYPGNMGYNADAFVFTLNMFPVSTGSGHVQVVSLNASDLMNGVASPATFSNNLADFSVRPATMHDAKAGDPMWLSTEHDGSTSIDVIKMTNVLSGSAVFTYTNLPVTNYSAVVPPLNPGGSQVTTNLDSRIQNVAVANNTLVAVHAVSISGTQDVAQWYVVDISGATPVMSKQGRISAGPNTYITYPAIDINPSSQIGICYIQSGTDTPTDFPSVWVTAGTASTLTVGTRVPAGTGQKDLNGGGREGDFSGINVDPVDGTFWAANEFATSAGGTNWGTAIVNFKGTLVVTNANDSGPGSLRQAVLDSNTNPGTDAITFDPLFFATSKTITLTSGELMITDAVNIFGPGVGLATVSGNNANRVFETNVSSGVVSISGLSLVSGNDTTGLGGGAIRVSANNTLQISNCAISNNTSNAGGGIFVVSGGLLSVTSCALTGDVATTGSGGAVYFAGTVPAGGATIRNSTLAGNSAAAGSGGAIAASALAGTLVVQNCTITGNSAATGGGIARIGGAGVIGIDSTILFGDTAGSGPEISTAGVANVNTSLVQSTSGVGTFNGDVFTNANLGVDPLLGPLQNNGGNTSTRLPAAGSPAINKGSNPAGLTTDQRGSGFPRILGGVADIGAVEIPAPLIVTNNNDAGAGSLRQAISDANGIGGANTITFDPTFFATAKTITLTTGELAVTDSLTLTSPAVGVTISGNNTSRAFNFSGGTTSTLSGITVTLGKSTGMGGGIFLGAGNLGLQRCTITGCTSTGGGGLYSSGSLSISYCTFSGNTTTSTGTGGAVYSSNATSMTIVGSTFSGNSSAGNGGGIQISVSGTINITNSTISGNTSAGNGGGIRAGGTFAGTININNSTVAFNKLTGGTSSGSGLSRGAGTINVVSSIVAKNSGGTGGDLAGSFNVNFSFIGATDGATITGSNNITGTLASSKDPLLAALANNGGPTQTHRLQAGSLAINAGSNSLALTTDQRGPGFVRASGAVDMGAFEVQPGAHVLSVQVNDGTPQRSRVTSLTITFDLTVTLPVNPASAFTLKRQSDSMIVTMNGSVMGNSVTLTFNGGPVDFGSLADGRYTLTALAAQINGGNFDGNNDGTIGDDFVLVGDPATNKLFRLYGDSDGNGLVDGVDFGAFRTAFNTNSNVFDFDGSGVVDGVDFGLFRSRFGVVI